jgi:hypothetical protein
VTELMRVGQFTSVELLDQQVLLLFNKEEQERVLRERAVQWRREIRLLAVLGRMGPAETRATIRAIDEAVGAVLPGAPAVPSDLLDAVGELFVAQADLRERLAEQLVDSLAGQGPDREELLVLAKGLGVVVERLPILTRALEAPRRDKARAIKGRSDRLSGQGIVPARPEGLKAPPPKGTPSKTGRKKVTAVKVGESHDRRKRELGDEGEQWALAAVVGQLIRLTTDDRDRAIDEVVELFARWFDGPPVDAALAHSDAARSRDLDEEELIDELTGLLHVSRHSDAFGFDLVGWLALAPEAEPRFGPVCEPSPAPCEDRQPVPPTASPAASAWPCWRGSGPTGFLLMPRANLVLSGWHSHSAVFRPRPCCRIHGASAPSLRSARTR